MPKMANLKLTLSHTITIFENKKKSKIDDKLMIDDQMMNMKLLKWPYSV